MHEISTEIEIDATPEQVWSILMDFSAYPQWNPFIRSISGVVKTGERLNIFVQPTAEKGMKFRPTILVAAPKQELRWLGHFLLPGIFDGEHYFQIEEISPDRVRFIQGEKFSGLWLGFISLNLMAFYKIRLHRDESGLKASGGSETKLKATTNFIRR